MALEAGKKRLKAPSFDICTLVRSSLDSFMYSLSDEQNRTFHCPSLGKLSE